MLARIELLEDESFLILIRSRQSVRLQKDISDLWASIPKVDNIHLEGSLVSEKRTTYGVGLVETTTTFEMTNDFVDGTASFDNVHVGLLERVQRRKAERSPQGVLMFAIHVNVIVECLALCTVGIRFRRHNHALLVFYFRRAYVDPHDFRRFCIKCNMFCPLIIKSQMVKSEPTHHSGQFEL